MKVSQCQFYKNEWKELNSSSGFDNQKAQIVLAFASRELLENTTQIEHLKSKFPNAKVISASTSGEIIESKVYDDSISASALEFEKSEINCQLYNLKSFENSHALGNHIFKSLTKDNLKGILIFSDGGQINGSDLVAGLNEFNIENVTITGGLSGDGANFKRTLTGLDLDIQEGNVVALGIYGDSVTIGFGSMGGWEEFGPQRTITKADKNVLYEIDNKSALTLYKQYLGPFQDELPASALLFPLSLESDGNQERVVRTILSLNDEDDSMVFAGNMPLNGKIRLMKANFDKLIFASSLAAGDSIKHFKEKHKPEFAILISCVGRKLILASRIEEEVEAAKNLLDENTFVSGFYSYGEISPLNTTAKCELMNQTMTITLLSEN
jgi:hypothetical protein